MPSSEGPQFNAAVTQFAVLENQGIRKQFNAYLRTSTVEIASSSSNNGM